MITALTLLAAAPVQGQDSCRIWYDRARALFAHRDQPDSLRQRIAVARAGRQCYGDRAPERLNYFDFAEIASLTALRRNEEALQRYEAFFERQNRQPDSLWLRSGYHRRGYLHFTMGHYGQAIGDYARAIDYARTARPLRRAQLLHDLGLLFQLVRDYSAGAMYLREAEAIVDSLGRASSGGGNRSEAETLKTTLMLSRAALALTREGMNGTVDRGALNRAARTLETAVTRSAAGPSPSQHVQALGYLAEARAYLGDTEESLRLIRQATQLADRHGDADLQVFVAHKTGVVHLAAGQYEAARRALEHSTAMALQVQNLEYLQRGLTLLGLASELAGDLDRAETDYTRAIDYTEVKRADLGTTPLSAAAFSTWQEPYRGLVRVRLARGRVAEAFLALEQTRARRLADLKRETDLLAGAPPGTFARYDSLSRALVALRDHLRSDTLSPGSRIALKNREAILLEQRSRLLHFEAATEPPDLPALRRRLAHRNRVLLAYFVDEGDPLYHRPAHSFAFVMTPDTLAAVPLPVTGRSLRTTLDDASPMLHAEASTWGINAINFRNTALKSLYDQVYAPLASFIPDGAPLVIIPDGLLHLVPFAALVETDVPPFRYDEASFLIARHPLSVELSAGLLMDTPAGAASQLDLRAYGKTRFTDAPLAAAMLPPAFRAGPFPNLPAVTGELTRLERLFSSTETLLDEDATEAAFLAPSAPPKILHIASHTVVNAYSPLYNAIILSPDPGQDDGMVFLYELRRQLPATHLVTLSGCSTARGTLYRGEGMSGLHYAFREMGVPSSVATLWLADDEAIARLMDRFYRHLRDGLPKDVALQQAQLAYLAEVPPALRNPFFWAAPVLYGNADPIPLAGRYAGLTTPGWVVVLLFSGIVLLFVVRRFRS